MSSQKTLVIGHTDGHGIAATAVSMMNLELEAFQPEMLVKHPETNFPPKFWNETIKTVDPSKYEKIVIVDIPFDRNNFGGCKAELRRLGSHTKTVYIDHHIPLPGSIEDIANCCKVKIVPSAYQVVYGNPDNYWSVIGAISDRIPENIRDKITDELIEMSFGLDAASRKNAGEAVERILKNDKQYFIELAKTVPEPADYETKENFVLIKGKVPEGWKLKMLDKSMKKTGSDYALFLSENVPDQQNPGQNCDFLTVTKYWLSELTGTANDILPEQIRDKAFGHPNARIVKLSIGEGGKILKGIYKVEPYIGRVKSDLHKILTAKEECSWDEDMFSPFGLEGEWHSSRPRVRVHGLTRYALASTIMNSSNPVVVDQYVQYDVEKNYEKIVEAARNHPLWVLVKLGQARWETIFTQERIELPPYIISELPQNIRDRLVKTGETYRLGTKNW